VTTKMAGDRKKLFHLREYDAAFLKVFSRVIHLRAEEAYPLLKEIPTEPRPAIHTSQVTLPSGEALTNEPFEMKVACCRPRQTIWVARNSGSSRKH
jgi:hypothetical protein